MQLLMLLAEAEITPDKVVVHGANSQQGWDGGALHIHLLLFQPIREHHQLQQHPEYLHSAA